MADTNSSPTKTADKQPLVPPDEQFWQRYSPHHELPLSATTSVMLHGLALALIVALAYLAFRHTEASKPLSVDAITIAGGSGDPNGADDGKEGAGKSEDTGEPGPKQTPRSSTEPKETLKQASVDPLSLPEYKGPDGRLLEDASEETKKLANLAEDTRKKLFDGLARSKKGEGGGTDGGKGKGKGGGEGDLEGPGKGNISARQKRVLRWTMIFNTRDGNDYRRQLHALKAILAIPDPSGEYKVIHDLTKRPVQAKVEDLSEIKRIFWVDDQPQSIGPLAQALGLTPPPERIVAFFPVELEEELLRLEKAYRGKEEHEIKETRFRVDKQGNTYVPRVEMQR